jgi:stage II sporulation protein AA (anti-sigma F factor antagonist)
MDDEKVKVEIKENGNISVVFVSGELTLLDAPDLKNSLDAILEKGIRRFLFDFENLDFLDSSGISLLLRFHAQLAKLNGKIAFVHFHKNVANTMHKALPRHIRETAYFEDSNDALSYLR